MLDPAKLTKDRPPDESASELVLRIASGDRHAESRLYSRYWRGVYFVLFRDCRDHELAADVAQDALLKVILAAREGAIRDPVALNSYVRSVAVNMLISHRRKEKRRTTETRDRIEIPDSCKSPLESISQSQIEGAVRQILAEMKTERDRDLIERFYLRGESKAVICRLWGLTPDQFDGVLYRARRRMRKIVAERHANGDASAIPTELLTILLAITTIQAAAQLGSGENIRHEVTYVGNTPDQQ